jgi:nitrite reductase/ring-hydroxylating ferredoxin subunit
MSIVTTTSRRNFLKAGWRLGGSLLAVAAGWTVFESLRPLGGTTKGGPVMLAATSSYPAGTATYVPEGRLFIANTGTTLLAISQKCPHLGCRVPFCDSSGRFECPCHGSVFDLGGEWIEGPSPVGMTQYPISLDGDAVVVDTSKEITGPARGANQYFSPPKGPNCQPKG